MNRLYRRNIELADELIAQALRRSAEIAETICPLPTLAERQLIADATHFSVSHVLTGSYLNTCAYYSSIGRVLCEWLTGHRYGVVGGKIRLNEKEGRAVLFDPRKVDDGECHLALEHAFAINEQGGRLFVMDLYARNLGEHMVLRHGLRWEYSSPDFFWTDYDCLDSDFQSLFLVEPALTRKMRGILGQDRKLLCAMAETGIKWLSEKGYKPHSAR